MNDETSIKTQGFTDVEAHAAYLASLKPSDGEASPEEAEVFITEDTADHSATIH